MPLAPAGNPLKHDRFQLTSSERFCPLPFLMAIRAYKMGKTCGHRAFARPLNASSTKTSCNARPYIRLRLKCRCLGSSPLCTRRTDIVGSTRYFRKVPLPELMHRTTGRSLSSVTQKIPSQRCLRCSQGQLTGRRRIIAGDWKDRNDRITDILQDVTFAADDAKDDQIEEALAVHRSLLRKLICQSAENTQVGEQALPP